MTMTLAHVFSDQLHIVCFRNKCHKTNSAAGARATGAERVSIAPGEGIDTAIGQVRECRTPHNDSRRGGRTTSTSTIVPVPVKLFYYRCYLLFVVYVDRTHIYCNISDPTKDKTGKG